MALRDEFPDIYPQVFGRKDITKMGRDELLGAIQKVKELGTHAESISTAEMVSHEQEEEIGF